ncbi:hypothetical protein ID866_10697 [Astraeus odoratus]|nr:hypothetical protein ID866_10697 [Astraeus odoratus]
MGPPGTPRVVVGHNFLYDRQRILEEYSLTGTQTRFLDTMALHVAVKGISSHQRPAWMKHCKSKAEKRERREEAVELVVGMLQNTEAQCDQEASEDRRAELPCLRNKLEEGLAQLQSEDFDMGPKEGPKKSWEDLTSANSLADVAKLYCNIDMDKEIREDFIKATPTEVLENIADYLSYCANDCAYHGLEFPSQAKVKKRLIGLADKAKNMMVDQSWKDNPWLAQLDWTPKVVGKSWGAFSEEQLHNPNPLLKLTQPTWLRDLLKNGPLHTSVINRTLPLLLRMSFDGYPLQYSVQQKWHYIEDGVLMRLPTAKRAKTLTVLSPTHCLPNLKSGRLSASDIALARDIPSDQHDSGLEERILALARSIAEQKDYQDVPSLCQLDWTPATVCSSPILSLSQSAAKLKLHWPKWYWDLACPKKGMPPGTLDITVCNCIAPILLQLSWLGWPLFHSREHGWTFHVRKHATFSTCLPPLEFFDPTDQALLEMAGHDHVFYKLPHKDGDKANVGSPLGKTFIRYAQDGTLTSPGGDATDALDMNAQCSYWMSARDRILNQMVIWQDNRVDMRIPDAWHAHVGNLLNPLQSHKWGMILPQVVTMGTIMRRVIEKTWLTASNAKKNRVGSELKAMVRAPKGYAIVGADVDSEELWISSCMGDAQFGLHGAMALGWMTLEGTKAAGTDLHSKTAGILGISRDQAKVFNYS